MATRFDRPRLLVALFAAAALTIGNAQPTEPAAYRWQTGGDVLSLCTNTDWYATLACIAYLDGTVRGAQADAIYRRARGGFCIPSGTSSEMVREAVVRHLRGRPSRRDAMAAVVVYTALVSAYPCPAQ